MSKKPERSALPQLLEAQELSDGDSPTIVLDVDQMEDASHHVTIGTSTDGRTLPDELLGMYYHG